MSLENKRKQLIFRSWHRGTKEMDLLMGTFADKNVPSYDALELTQYEDVLKESDPDLYSWIMGTAQPPANVVTPVLTALLKHTYTQKDNQAHG